MVGIRVTRNGIEKLYPCVEFDIAAAITAGFDDCGGTAIDTSDPLMPSEHYYVFGPSINGVVVQYNNRPVNTPVPDGVFGDGLITDPRSDDQIVWFSDDTVTDSFGPAQQYDTQPDDFFIDNVNVMYYTGTMDSPTATRMRYTLAGSITQGVDYYRCESTCALIETSTGFYFGETFFDGYFTGIGWYYWFISLYQRYQTQSMGTQNQFILRPQYELGMNKFVTTGYDDPYFDLVIPETDYTINDDTPTDMITQFCHAVYNDIEYVGYCAFRIVDGVVYDFNVVLLPMFFWGATEPFEPPGPVVPDPGDFGPESQPDAGGDGTYSDTNTAPDAQAGVNLVGGMSAYGLHLYRISQTNYGAVLDALWGTSAISDAMWQRWENYKFNPLQGIIVNHFVPYDLTPASLSTAVIQMAGVTLLAAAATADVLTTQYKDHTVGTLSIPEFFGSALDYSPYTVMRLYLPFCGWIDIDPDRVNGGSITVKYRCDVVSGDVCAYVICTDRTGSATSMYTATGNCAVALPITGNDQGTGQIVGGLQSAVLGSVTGAITGNVLGAASSLIGGVSSALTAQHHMQQTGSYSGSVALISDRQCRLQIIRPAQSTPAYGQQLRGRPSDIGCLIGDLIGTGWSSFDAVHAEIDGATADEQAEIERLLHIGVIL